MFRVATRRLVVGRRSRGVSFLAASLMVLASPAFAAPTALKVGGSSTVNPVVAEAAEALRDRGMKITVDPSGGSSGGIAGLGEGRLDVAMSSRPLSDRDRDRFPSASFIPTRIGVDAVALVVSRDVWEAGLRSLTRDQMRAIYEGRARRWSDVGGPDQRIVFFNKEVGRGTWEVFANWLYGDADTAPLVSFPEVGSNEETRNKVAATKGAMSQLSAAWADGERVFALAVEGAPGEVVAPTDNTIASGRYPISRPLYVITDGSAAGDARTLLDYLLAPAGQALVTKHGFLPTSSNVSPTTSP